MSSINWLKKLQGYKQQVKKEQLDFLKKATESKQKHLLEQLKKIQKHKQKIAQEKNDSLIDFLKKTTKSKQENSFSTDPSLPVYDIYVPKTTITDSKFVYNFFVKDESTNSDQQLLFEDNIVVDDNRLSRLPRYNQISIQNGTISKSISEKNVTNFIKKPRASGDKGLRTKFDSILTESNFDNNRFTGLTFKDDGLDGKLNTILLGALRSKIFLNTYETGQDNLNKPTHEFDLEDASALDLAKKLNTITTDDVDSDFLSNSMTINKIDYNKLFDKIKNLNIQFQLNNETIDDIITNVINDPTSLYSDEAITIKEYAEKAQEAINNMPEKLVNMRDYYALVNYITLKYLVENEVFESKIIGYVIKKYEVVGNSLTKLPDIIIDNPETTNVIDHKVKYGTSYVYEIKTIASVIIESIDISTNKLYAAEFYVTSTPSDYTRIDCVEFESPPPPYDFKVRFDYEQDSPILTWAFPPNSQRDIKIFQIFKRKSLNEPFQLISQYDFNDSDVKYLFDENVNKTSIQTLKSPKLHYVDYSFNKHSMCIYAVCCVDAHGLSSGYSMQTQTKFDVTSNKLITDMISISGAPKQYPNAFVDADDFVDVIKNTGYKKCHIYFEPEFLRLYQGDNNQKKKLNLLSTDKNDGKYILQIINTDNQKQQSITIKLNDKTKDEQQV
jgi:hypothetical protein